MRESIAENPSIIVGMARRLFVDRDKGLAKWIDVGVLGIVLGAFGGEPWPLEAFATIYAAVILAALALAIAASGRR